MLEYEIVRSKRTIESHPWLFVKVMLGEFVVLKYVIPLIQVKLSHAVTTSLVKLGFKIVRSKRITESQPFEAGKAIVGEFVELE